ncbi:TPA: hypothetical protein KNG91_002999 [Serratia fonticola]|nr:hypothetical protein [Serratia fonticola]
MVLFCLGVVFIIALGVMERRGIIDDGQFAVAVVLTLLAVAGPMVD